jgi:hypothetical protein
MEDFVLLFRQPDTYNYNLSQSNIETAMKRWDKWFNDLEGDGKLVNAGIQLGLKGKVLKAGGVVTDGPFVEIRERLNGFIVVKAESLDDAVTLAHGCPILDIDGTVEVRPFFIHEQMKGHLLSV